MPNFINILVGVAIIVATLFLGNNSWANSLGVDPLYVEILPGQSAAVRVTNYSDVDTPVELFIHERMVDPDGIQTRKDAEDEFIIFPPQAIIKANKTQVFRLQTLRKNLNKSKSYYLSIRQLPVDLGKADEGVRLQVVFAFDAAIHLIPRGVEAKPIVESVKPTTIEIAVDGETGEVKKTFPALDLTVRNDGSKFFYLQDQNYIATSLGTNVSSLKEIQWSVEEILLAVKVVLVNPGTSRTFKLPLPEGLNPEDYSVKVEPRN